MNKKITLILLFLMFFGTAIFAKDVNRSKAEKVAVNFFFQKSNQYGNKTGYNDINIIDSYKVDDAYYVVNFENGWVLVSAEDALVPVLGYDLKGNFPSPEKLGKNARSFIRTYVDEVHYVKENNISATEDIKSLWEEYSTSNSSTLDLKGGKDVSPLLDPIAWNQDYPWNVLCPEDPAGPGGHVYVGCVATAMSQIMYYWRYPLQGHGSKSYYLPNYGTITANFDTTHYNWNGMKSTMDTRNVYDMALIGFHAGVSVKMNYSPDGSGSQSAKVPFAMKTYFKYSSSIKYIEKEDYSLSYWESKLQSELNAKRPVYYSGFSNDGGHAFVCDGYQTGNINYYHFNFGWSGSANGFYTLNDVGGFNSGQGMVHTIKPGDANYPYIATGTDTLTRLAGSFTDGSGPAEQYPAGMNAQWLISPQTTYDSVSTIKIHFVKMKTGSNDVITIYDGPTTDSPEIGSWSGTNMPSDFTVENNQVLVTFTSSSSNDGFVIEYSTTGATWCSGTQEYTDPYGTVTDGSINNFHYNSGTNCTFYLHHPEAIDYHIEFTEFETEPEVDKLVFYTDNGTEIATFSGSDIPEPFNIDASGIVLFWTTNASNNYQGWSFDYTVGGVGVKENNSFDNYAIYPNPAKESLKVMFTLERANNIEISLVDIQGQKVFYENINALDGTYSKSINVESLPSGIYILNIVSNKGNLTRKIIIQ